MYKHLFAYIAALCMPALAVAGLLLFGAGLSASAPTGRPVAADIDWPAVPAVVSDIDWP
ncbi:hypothetical protein AB0B54_08585 [Microbispora bryophytorum]